MKKIKWVVVGFVLLSWSASAQDVSTNEVINPSQSNSRFNKNARVIPISNMDQRKIYNWGNGQRSTPTGRQSGSRNVNYAKVFGDSAIVVNKPAHATRKPGTSNAFRHATIVPISRMDQRKIYNWGIGQRSTPTGRQSGRRNVNYAKVAGDSAIVVPNPSIKNYQ